jgi:predicted dinucleotide-binding enzyme
VRTVSDISVVSWSIHGLRVPGSWRTSENPVQVAVGKSRDLARELDGSVGAGTVGNPVAGDVVVLAGPYEAAAPLVRQYGEALSGKVVVDIVNPVDWQTFDGLVIPPDTSAAEEIDKAAPEDARVVKVVNITFAGTLVEGQVAGQSHDVYVAGDGAEAKETVLQLAHDGGLVAIEAGPLRRERQLEGLGFLGMTLQQPLGTNFRNAWKLVSSSDLECLS